MKNKILKTILLFYMEPKFDNYFLFHFQIPALHLVNCHIHTKTYH